MQNKKKTFKEILLQSPWTGRTLAVIMAILLVIKQWVVFLIYHGQIDGKSFFTLVFHYAGFLANDFLVLTAVVLLVFINFYSKVKWLKITCLALDTLLLIIYFVDIITIYYFQSRLSIFDFSSFLNISNGGYFSGYVIGVLLFCALMCIGLFVLVQKFLSRKTIAKNQMYIVVGIFICSMICSFINFMSYRYDSLQENILLLNYHEIQDKFSQQVQSPPQLTTGEKAYQEYFTTIPGQNQRLNVIMVIAESFSTVDSKRVDGLYDHFPFFDKMQKDGITFANFIANGCTSETAHIALLQGIEPRQNPTEKSQKSYYTYANYVDTLPVFFNNLGYQTTFLSTVTLDFLNQKDFVQSMQFQSIIGEENFKDEKKYVFDAAPDHVLYEKALEIAQSGSVERPIFLVMQTISSHKPYNTPLGVSKENMYKYVDRNLYAFYTKLKKIGFFDNGILVVVGDHRKMEAINTIEFKKYGMSSHSRVLATIIGKGIKEDQIDKNIIQHVDIFHSLKYLMGSGDVLVWKDFNNIFKSKEEERDRGVRYCRFSERNYAIIKKDGEAYTLRAADDPYIQHYIQAYKTFQYGQLIGTGYDPLYFTNYRTGSFDPDFMVISHRGDPTQDAENSFKGLALAKDYDVQGIEFDVSYTKDKKNVVFHGPSMVNTACGKNAKIYDYTLAELQKKCTFENGESIMTLEDLLQQTKTWFDLVFLEIKVHEPDKAEEQTLDAIETVTRLGLQDKVIFISYDKTANYIIGGYKGIKAGRDAQSVENLHIVGKFPHDYFLINKDLVTEEVVKTMEMLGKKLIVYTVDTQEEFNRIYDLGVRAIITDDVKTIQNALTLKKRGK